MITILFVVLAWTVLKIGLRLAWGVAKVLFGLLLFVCFPGLFLLGLVFHGGALAWIPLLLLVPFVPAFARME